MECHLKWNINQNGRSLKIEYQSNGMSLKMECHFKMECHSIWNVTKD